MTDKKPESNHSLQNSAHNGKNGSEKQSQDKMGQEVQGLNRDVPTPKERRRIGLALGGGVARGFAHIGAIRALQRHGIEPGIVAGTSIGAVVGACYLAGKMDELEKWGRSLGRLKLLSYLDFKVKSAGLIGGHRLERLMRADLGDGKIEDLPLPFIAVATDLITGHEVWMRNGDIVNACTASFSLPGIFPPVERNGRFLIDGALVNPVPVSVCQALGARMTIGIDLSADMIGKASLNKDKVPRITGYDMFDEAVVPQKQQKQVKKSALTRRLFRRDDDEQPSLFGVMVSSLSIIQDRITRSRLAGDPPDIHVRPHVGHIGLMEFDRVDELIAAGEASIERILPDILAAKAVFFGEEQDQ